MNKTGSLRASAPAFRASALGPAFRASALGLGLVLSSGVAHASELVSVAVNHARVIRLPEKTQTVVVGNPAIADVTIQKGGNLVVTGKSFGITNLIALDPAGNIIAESKLRVEASNEATVLVYRGIDRETYSCAPGCEAALNQGDSTKFFTETGARSERSNALAAPK